MAPKEKAEALIDRFIQQTRNRYDRISISHIRAKQCALIAVDEMLAHCDTDYTKYLEQVKIEIINH